MGGGKIQVYQKVKTRFLQLFVPFVMWAIISRISHVKDTYIIFVKPDYGLWFLLVLFMINLFYYVGMYFFSWFKIKNILLLTFLTYILLRIVNHFVSGYMGVEWAVVYFPYFAIGTLLYDVKERLHRLQIKWLVPIFLIVFCCLSFWFYRSTEYIPAGYPRFFFLLNNSTAYRYTTALMGSSLLLLVGALYLDGNKYVLLSKIGRITMSIYVIHQTVIRCLNDLLPTSALEYRHTVFGLFLCFAVVFIITMAVRYLLLSWRISRILFLGEK